MEALKLDSLSADQVPDDLKAATYFDFSAHPFAHQALLDAHTSVCTAIAGIHEYTANWLHETISARRDDAQAWASGEDSPIHCTGRFRVLLEDGAVFEPSVIVGRDDEDAPHTIYLEADARVVGARIYLDRGDILVGPGSSIEPGAGIRGPAIIGGSTEIRQDAYLRGDCVVGSGCTLRGEVKNSVIMDRADFPHHSYLGDSLCGYRSHFGNQATAANLGIYAGLAASSEREPIVVACDDKAYDIGRSKMGVCMGDFCQVGCNSVTDPATFLKPYTIAYSLTRIPKGFYGPNEVLKNKPLAHGVIERAPYRH